MRRLTSGNSAWIANLEKSRLWFGQDGLFPVWLCAAEDVQQLLDADQLAGIPKAPETMLELLLAVLACSEAAAAGRATWSIQPPGARGSAGSRQAPGPGHSHRGNRSAPGDLAPALEFKPARASAPVAPQTLLPCHRWHP
ncbi:MAG: TraI domain-containing protein [Zoogloea sp.]|nr:TraI domain-containing protein [Zoogloea sp.]